MLLPYVLFSSSAVRTTLLHFFNFLPWMLFRLILPLLSSYVAAGEFTIGGKIKTALFENAVIYGTLGLLFGVLLIYVVASKHLSRYVPIRTILVTIMKIIFMWYALCQILVRKSMRVPFIFTRSI